MAYNASSPPSLIAQAIGGGGQVWAYENPDDKATINTAGYFSNGKDLGMKTAATIIGTDTDTSFGKTFYTVNAVSATGTDVTDGLDVGTTDTD
jgi:hypothetical protein